MKTPHCLYTVSNNKIAETDGAGLEERTDIISGSSSVIGTASSVPAVVYVILIGRVGGLCYTEQPGRGGGW